MTNYAFNQDGNGYGETMGIPEDRVEMFQSATKAMAFRAAISDKNISRDSQAFEELLNDLQPQNVVEAILIGRLFGGYLEMNQRIAKKMAKQLK